MGGDGLFVLFCFFNPSLSSMGLCLRKRKTRDGVRGAGAGVQSCLLWKFIYLVSTHVRDGRETLSKERQI